MRESLCNKCGVEPRRESHSYCLVCHSSYMKEWRKRNPLTKIQKLKDSARSYAGVYLRKGKIHKKPCEVCDSVLSQMHHDDYSKPLDIRWLCRNHHLSLHKNEANRKNNLHFI